MYDDRLMVPDGIREKVLEMLHAAHQDRSSMVHRAALTVFWPGYTADLEEKGRLPRLQHHRPHPNSKSRLNSRVRQFPHSSASPPPTSLIWRASTT